MYAQNTVRIEARDPIGALLAAACGRAPRPFGLLDAPGRAAEAIAKRILRSEGDRRPQEPESHARALAWPGIGQQMRTGIGEQASASGQALYFARFWRFFRSIFRLRFSCSIRT